MTAPAPNQAPNQTPGQTPNPAELAAVAAQIADEFPFVLDQTSLVLLDLDPAHLHAFWTLAPNDLAKARSAFPGGDGEPELVLRLRRLHPEGRAEILKTLPLAVRTRGDTRFTLASDDAGYEAEIGLQSGRGGWMLLARSNQARLPRSVGIPIPPFGDVQPASVAHAPEPPAPVEDQAAPGPTPMPRPPNGGLPSPAPPPPAGTRPATWVLRAASTGAAPPTPQRPKWEAGAPEDVAPAGLEPTPQTSLEPDMEPTWRPAIRLDWPWVDQADLSLDGQDGAWGAEHPPPSGQVSTGVPAWTPAARPSPDAAAPVSSFALGHGPEAPTIEAELLVHVTAKPGTLVDLHGRPLRVGPSGRSTLRIAVTDLACLATLLRSPGEAGRKDDGG